MRSAPLRLLGPLIVAIVAFACAATSSCAPRHSHAPVDAGLGPPAQPFDVSFAAAFGRSPEAALAAAFAQ